MTRSFILTPMDMPAPHAPHPTIMTVSQMELDTGKTYPPFAPPPPRKWSVSGEIPATAVLAGIVTMALATIGNIWLGGRYVERLETRINTIEKEMQDNRAWRDKHDTARSEIKETLAVIRSEVGNVTKESDRTRTSIETILSRLPKP